MWIGEKRIAAAAGALYKARADEGEIFHCVRFRAP